MVRTARSAPRRLLLAALAVAFPVAVLASTLLFVDDSVHDMTAHALAPVQVNMRALATSLDVDMAKVNENLGQESAIAHLDRYGATNVVVGAAGAPSRVSARLVAVDQSYFDHHPWVSAEGDVSDGVLLNGGVAESAGFGNQSRVSIELRGAEKPLGLELPVAGRVDTRHASTWFAIPAGEVQGDVAVTPRVVVVSYSTFETEILPALQEAYGGPSAVTNPGLSELPTASVESHISVDPSAYPTDPARAAAWSNSFRRVLERSAPGDIIVADNTVEPLTESARDATSAKLIFFLLGIPGVLVAAALGLAAASALAEAHRREDALLRLRGASDAQLVRFAAEQGFIAGAVGVLLGLAVSAAAVSAVVGHVVWRDMPATRLLFVLLCAIAAGMLTTAARLIPLVRSHGRPSLAEERRLVPGAWTPAWRRARLDVVALCVGLGILAVNLASGGLKLPLLDTDRQGQTLALSFFVLLAPVALWVGLALLAVRASLVLLARRTRPDLARPLSSWRATAVRWLGRRPARTAVALSLGALAVAFGTEVVTFTATYANAKQADAAAAFGADLRLEAATDVPRPLPPLGADITSTAPIRYIPARAGSDRKTIAAIDPDSYEATATTRPRILEGGGTDALRQDPTAVILSLEMVADFDLKVGDTLPVTLFPDDLDLSQKFDFHVAGVFRSFPPDEPFSEMVMNAAALSAPVPAPDLYLARVSPGRTANDAADGLRAQGVEQTFAVTTPADVPRQQQRSLTALNLDGLSRIEAVAAGLIAAVGVGVLGAFIVLERRREFALLRMVGASTRQLLTPPALEGAVAAVGSVLIGIPLGIGLAILAVRVLGLFFTLPPPLVSLPIGALIAIGIGVLAASAIALMLALRRVSRLDVAQLLREP